jgi:hypothetical protein
MTRLLVSGTDEVRLPTDSTGKRAGFVKSAIGAAGSEIYLPTSVLVDDAGNTIDSAAAVPAGTERGLIVRPITGPAATFSGLASTFRVPGRAGTAGQSIFSLHNATGSTKIVKVNKITVDLVATVIKAVTVLPPIIRVWKITVLPTNGTAVTKVPLDSALTSSGSVTVLQDASADSTSSASALTTTRPAGTVLTQEYAPRLITAVGYEMFDRTTFFDGETDVTLRALEGIVVFLDYTLATQNPTTDMWTATCEWDEF